MPELFSVLESGLNKKLEAIGKAHRALRPADTYVNPNLAIVVAAVPDLLKVARRHIKLITHTKSPSARTTRKALRVATQGFTKPVKPETVKGQILAFYVRNQKATCDDVEAALSIKHHTASSRISELVRDGLLTATDTRRRTRSGHMARVISFSPPAAVVATAEKTKTGRSGGRKSTKTPCTVGR